MRIDIIHINDSSDIYIHSFVHYFL